MYDPKLEALVHSKYLFERAEAVRQGYGLDVLINDSESCIRLLIAEQGYGLDILVNDENWAVCDEVKRQLGKFL